MYEIVKDMWRYACTAEEGEEAEYWPEAWKKAIQIPLWKKKGCMKDKNTWRGVTLLSVGTKVLARVVEALGMPSRSSHPRARLASGRIVNCS